jgi:NADPH:quinone reductase-like Zn-dependent oxidoreductase
MRAAVLHEYGATPVYEPDWPEPEAGEGQAVVDVVLAGVNPVDLRRGSGTFYGGSPDVPYVVGEEGIARRHDGSLAYFNRARAPWGSWAERSLIDPTALIPLPDGLEPAVAVGLGIAGCAAWLALEWRAGLREGETVLVLGASGAVGMIGVQAARLLGAGRVVGAARSAEGLRRASELGADATVRLGSDDDGAALRDALGDGADVVVDPLWGRPLEAALGATHVSARVVQLGESAGATATLPAAIVRGRALSVLGHTNLVVPHQVARDAYERMARHAAAGELQLDTEEIPLERAAEAWERQASAPHHKLVIAVG